MLKFNSLTFQNLKQLKKLKTSFEQIQNNLNFINCCKKNVKQLLNKFKTI